MLRHLLPAIALVLSSLAAAPSRAAAGSSSSTSSTGGGSPSLSRAEAHVTAALLFESSLDLAPTSESPAAEVEAAAVDGLVASGAVLQGEGHTVAALQALNSVLGTRDAELRPLPRPHMVAMLHKLRALQLWYAFTDAKNGGDMPAPDPKATRPYWLNWPAQWEEGRGAVVRAAGCDDGSAGTALDHLAQVSADVEIYRSKRCYVGFHGVALQHREGRLGLLQQPGAPETGAALLTLWALQMIPADFEPQGELWPFWLPLARGSEPADFSADSIVRRAAALTRSLGLGTGDLRRMTRAELEAVYYRHTHPPSR